MSGLLPLPPLPPRPLPPRPLPRPWRPLDVTASAALGSCDVAGLGPPAGGTVVLSGIVVEYEVMGGSLNSHAVSGTDGDLDQSNLDYGGFRRLEASRVLDNDLLLRNNVVNSSSSSAVVL